jgi:hypothetical protein
LYEDIVEIVVKWQIAFIIHTGGVEDTGKSRGGVDKIAWKSRGGVDKISWKSRVGGDDIENPREGVLNYFQNTVRGSPISMIVKE